MCLSDWTDLSDTVLPRPHSDCYRNYFGRRDGNYIRESTELIVNINSRSWSGPLMLCGREGALATLLVTVYRSWTYNRSGGTI